MYRGPWPAYSQTSAPGRVCPVMSRWVYPEPRGLPGAEWFVRNRMGFAHRRVVCPEPTGLSGAGYVCQNPSFLPGDGGEIASVKEPSNQRFYTILLPVLGEINVFELNVSIYRLIRTKSNIGIIKQA